MKNRLMRSLHIKAITLSLALLLPCLDAAAVVVATGGTESTIPGYKVHAFTTTGSNSVSVAEGGYVEVLVVGGGGGGGNSVGGGGGAGGFVVSNRFSVVGGSNYTVTVGAGGLGSLVSEGFGKTTIGGRRGEDSSFAEFMAYGGGGGRNYQSDPPSPYLAVGSGGGMGGASSLGPCLGTDGQGHAGGLAGSSTYGGSGGGAGAAGQKGFAAPGATGGVGRASSITGTPTYYAGGGGGGTWNTTTGAGGPGGLGGGGAGSYTVGNSGIANSGGGGGGGGYQPSGYSGGDGGSGLVIIRYRLDNSLLILGSPANYGSATPPYGATNNLAIGNDFLCSVPTGWVSVASGTRATCTGYQLFTNDVLAVADATNAFNYTHASYGSLIWQWRSQHEITFSAGTGGTVSTSGGWYNEDSSVTVTATVTDPRRQFSYWTGDVPAGLKDNATLTFPADRPRAISAYFGGTYHVSTNGSDAADGLSWGTARRTIQSALTDAQDGDTVMVSNGTYSITAQIPITKGVALRSLNGVDVTTITRTGSGTHRILYLSHTNAVVDGFTISNGNYSGVNNDMGGGILIDYQGTISNCVIVANKIGYNQYGGGIALKQGGYVRNCRIIKNGGIQLSGAGVYLYKGGVVENCEIAGNFLNYSAWGGAGAYLDLGGLLKNCVITNNILDYVKSGNVNWPLAGGVVCNSGGTVESCTIADNYSQSVGGLVCKNGGAILNTIVYGNRSSAGGSPNYAYVGTGWSYTNCCTTPMVAGEGNVDEDPQFAGGTTTKLRLLAGSPCINAGTNQTWMASAADLGSNPRILGARVDIGAFEFNPDTFACNIIGTPPLIALASNRVEFTAAVAGPNQTGLYYRWDFQNDGIVDNEGYDRATVTPLYGPGLHTVRLVVSNELDEVVTQIRRDLIFVGPSVAHVVQVNAGSAPPYATWATAATNIQSAINVGVDGTLVLVSNGVYEITSQIDLQKGVTLRSVTDAATTTIKRKSGTSRILYMSHADAVVDGFTITGGNAAIMNEAMGGGVLIDSFGTVSNCVIVGNTIGINQFGGGIALNLGGTIKNSLIISNGINQTYGGGAYLCKGGVIENCEISDNIAGIAFAASKGGGAWLNGGGLLRNCLIRNNLCQAGTGGGVYFTSGGSAENCTIVSNDSSKAGGVYCEKGGTLLNSILYLNKSSNVATDNAVTSGTGWSFSYTCTTPAIAGTGNIEDDPLFVNPPYNYRLKHNSPCFNTGLKQPWMDTATDLDGLPRLQATKVDRGAYEYVPPTGTRLIIR